MNKKLGEIVSRINELLIEQDVVIVAIEGKCGAGKSTLGRLLQEHYQCNLFHMDDYFLTPALRTPERLAEIGGNVDYLRFKEEILEPILKGIEVRFSPYHCQERCFGAPIEIQKNQLNIVEGCYSMHPTLIDYFHLKIFLDIDSNTQIKRIAERNGEMMLKRFVEEWIPKENLYHETFGIREKCDLIYQAEQ